MPLQSRWPLFEARASTCFPSRVESQGEVLAVLHPEVAVEAALEVGCILLQPVRKLHVLPDQARQAGAAQLRVVGVALELARRPRKAGQPAVSVGDRVPGVLPALILEAGLLVAALVPDVAGAEQVGVLVDPVERRPGLVLELPHGLAVTGPALVLVEQHDVERRRVGTAVVRRMRPLLEGRHLPVAHLVQDAAGVLVAEVVEAAALPGPERSQGRLCELGGERQRLQAREDAVPAEHRHEPGQAGGRQVGAAGDGRREAERGHIDEAAPVRRLERLPVALDSRRVRDPPPEILLHGHLRSALGRGHHAGSRVGAEDRARRPARSARSPEASTEP